MARSLESRGGDGKLVTLVQVPEQAGRYEWIVDTRGRLTHARYRTQRID